MSILEGCSDSCGWTAALIALVCYGTYGVPIKQLDHSNNKNTKNMISVNPLVFQTYKTVVMLVVSPWFVALSNRSSSVLWRLLPGWGLVSGLLWVLGGTCGVVGVRWAGLSTAVATWASVMIGINFVWGILIFREPVANVSHTLCAFVLLGVGLIGMSHFAAPSSSQAATNVVEDYDHQPLATKDVAEEENDIMIATSSDDEDGEISMSRRRQSITNNAGVFMKKGNANGAEQGREMMLRRTLSSPDKVFTPIREEDGESETTPPFFNAETHVRLGRRFYSKRRVGILAAVANGILAGSSLIPVHYAKKHGFGGANYMMSYAVGAFTANLLVWLIYYAVLVVRLRPLGLVWGDRLVRAAGDMPDPQLEQLWKPGICAGLLLATAMFGSILAVTYLGQGIGNSVIQAKIIVSGMWGICYYKEIRDPHAIRNWFLSASLSVMAIIWLSHERIAAKAADGSHRSLLLSPETFSSC